MQNLPNQRLLSIKINLKFKPNNFFVSEKAIQKYLREIFGIINQLEGIEDKEDVLRKFADKSLRYKIEEEDPRVKTLLERRNFWNFKDLLKNYKDYRKEWYPYHNLLMKDHLERLVYGFILGSYFEANCPEALFQFYLDFYEGVNLDLEKSSIEEIIKNSFASEELKKEALKRVEASLENYKEILELLRSLSHGLKDVKSWIEQGKIENLRSWYWEWRKKLLLDCHLQAVFFYLLPTLFKRYSIYKSKEKGNEMKDKILFLFSYVQNYTEKALQNLKDYSKITVEAEEIKKIEEKKVRRKVRKRKIEKVEEPERIKERILELLEEPRYAHELREILNLSKDELGVYITELSRNGKIELEALKWKKVKK